MFSSLLHFWLFRFKGSWIRLASLLPLLVFPLAGAPRNQNVGRLPAVPDKDAKPIAYFTDIAKTAGLTDIVIFGGADTRKYIIETTGTGVAIFDYDNEGWTDIFVACDSTSSILYHNNHDGTFTDQAVLVGTPFN